MAGKNKSQTREGAIVMQLEIEVAVVVSGEVVMLSSPPTFCLCCRPPVLVGLKTSGGFLSCFSLGFPSASLRLYRPFTTVSSFSEERVVSLLCSPHNELIECALWV